MARPNNKANWDKYWSGVLMQKGLLNSGGTACSSVNGYTGGSGRPMLKYGTAGTPGCGDDNVDPVPSLTTAAPGYTVSQWYTDEGDQFDFAMNTSLMGPIKESWGNKVTATQPKIGNELVSSMTVVLMEWNLARNLPTNYVEGADNGQMSRHADLAPGFGMYSGGGMPTSVGYWQDSNGKAGGLRHTRHIGGNYGTNNFVFADNHVEGVEAKFEHPFWHGSWEMAGDLGKNTIAAGCDVSRVYPTIQFVNRWSAINNPAAQWPQWNFAWHKWN
jgi:hypothetical protein